MLLKNSSIKINLFCILTFRKENMDKMIKLSDIITKYSILMFVLSGILILVLDLKELKSKNLQREVKLAKTTAVILIAIGVLMFIIRVFI